MASPPQTSASNSHFPDEVMVLLALIILTMQELYFPLRPLFTDGLSDGQGLSVAENEAGNL